jgi:hypothetical protein
VAAARARAPRDIVVSISLDENAADLQTWAAVVVKHSGGRRRRMMMMMGCSTLEAHIG